MNNTIQIKSHEIAKIRKHGEDTYPEECCGVLIGKSKDEGIVQETRRMKNTNAGSRNTRYNIDPMELLKLEDELDQKGLTMLGIYHSHPDHPARPSSFDLNHAWPNLSYMVLSVKNGEAELLTSWRLTNEGKKFEEEQINIIEGENQ